MGTIGFLIPPNMGIHVNKVTLTVLEHGWCDFPSQGRPF